MRSENDTAIIGHLQPMGVFLLNLTVPSGEPERTTRSRAQRDFERFDLIRLQIKREAIRLRCYGSASVFDEIGLMHLADARAPFRGDTMARLAGRFVDPQDYGSVLAWLQRGRDSIVV